MGAWAVHLTLDSDIAAMVIMVFRVVQIYYSSTCMTLWAILRAIMVAPCTINQVIVLNHIIGLARKWEIPVCASLGAGTLSNILAGSELRQNGADNL